MKKIYLILSFIIVGVFAQAQTSVWNGGRKLWTKGKGTESNPYLIESAENLAFLAYAVNKGYNMKGVYFCLTTDINLNGSNGLLWTPIGLSYLSREDNCEKRRVGNLMFYFGGHFDGGGHKISDIRVVEETGDAGLFGIISNGNGEEDLPVVENVFVTDGYIKAGSNCGGIVGSASGYVSHCINGATVEATSGFAGGIVGAGGIIRNCHNTGNIISVAMAGGIVGRAGKIEECSNSGNVTGCVVGGIIGYKPSAIAINNCYNTGIVSNTECYVIGINRYAGGVIGYGSTITLTNCYNVGIVSGEGGTDMGCLVGRYGQTTTFENNYYLNTCSDDGAEGTPLNAEYMRTEEFLNALNVDGVWGMDTANVNNGFPVLLWNPISHGIEMEYVTLEGGSVSLSTGEAHKGEEVLININVETGYAIESIKVYNPNDTTQTVTAYVKNGSKSAYTYAFIMPNFDVKVKVAFKTSGWGVNEAAEETPITISPNPTNGKISVIADNLRRVSVFNTLGLKVLENIASGNSYECDMSRYGSGVYIMQIETANGIAVKRVVVNK